MPNNVTKMLTRLCLNWTHLTQDKYKQTLKIGHLSKLSMSRQPKINALVVFFKSNKAFLPEN